MAQTMHSISVMVTLGNEVSVVVQSSLGQFWLVRQLQPFLVLSDLETLIHGSPLLHLDWIIATCCDQVL